MGLADFGSWGVIVGLSLASALIAVSVYLLTTRSGRAAPAGAPPRYLGGLDTPRHYEFRNGYLVSDLEPDDCFLPDTTDRTRAWAELVDAISPLNPDLRPAMTSLHLRGDGFVLIGRSGADALSISGATAGESLIVTVATAQDGKARQIIHRDSFARYQDEIRTLRRAMDAAPVVMWEEGSDQQITWANGAYFRLAEQLAARDGPLVWPLRRIFAEQLKPLPDPGSQRRCRLHLPGEGEPSWFDISMTEAEGGALYIARPADQLVAAETGLRNFVQTLSKTFAHLPIGLAIFDKRRELVLFNPALLTISSLDPEWLSQRPSLFGFLDQLRERHRMPEPKDYKAWRAGLVALEQAAEDGSYQELWTLPSGETLRVIGRPHPDGAVAFMFEDISSEVSLTRKFRADLDLYQAVFDEDGAAQAVVSHEGRVILNNDAYAELWGHDPREHVAPLTLQEASRQWQAQAQPSPIWGDIRGFVAEVTDRAAWSDDIILIDGRVFECRVTPLRGGATLIAFHSVGSAIAAGAEARRLRDIAAI